MDMKLYGTMIDENGCVQVNKIHVIWYSSIHQSCLVDDLVCLCEGNLHTYFVLFGREYNNNNNNKLFLKK